MFIIDNAWQIPLSDGGIFRLNFTEQGMEKFRILSGKYIQNKISLQKDMKYIESLIVPGATDPVEPEEMYRHISDAIKILSNSYYSDIDKKIADIKSSERAGEFVNINYREMHDIKIIDNKDTFVELHIDDVKFILVESLNKGINRRDFINRLVTEFRNIISEEPQIRFSCD
ncbi:MAG: hypothetical protein QXZ44_05680 [Ferroplasma sp.]